MKQKRTNGKGQVFSIDVLFSLLPIIMILGASLQYVYLAEEQLINSELGYQLDSSVQLMSEYVVSQINSEERVNCNDIGRYLNDYRNDVLGPGEGYALRMVNQNEQAWTCQQSPGQSSFFQNPPEDENSPGKIKAMSASQVRFIANLDSPDSEPGDLISLHFMRWKNP